MKRKFQKQILRYGKWEHSSAPDGVLEINEEYAKKLVENYNNVSPYAPVFRGHIDNAEAEKNPELIVAKNINSLEIKDNGVYAEFEIDEKELDYYEDVSASINPNYKDHETGKILGPMLTHVALVTNPYIKKLDKFVPLKEEIQFNILLSEISMKKTKKTEANIEAAEVEVETTDSVTEEVVEAPAEVVEEKAEETVTEEVVTEEKTEEVVEEPKEEKSEEVAEATALSETVEEKVELSELEQLKVELAEEKAKNQKIEAENFYNVLLREAKVTPAIKDEVIALASINDSTIRLGESETSYKAVLKNFFDKMPALVNLKELGVDVEQGKQPSEINLSEPVKEAARKTFQQLKPNGTDEDFEAFLIEHADKYKQVDK